MAATLTTLASIRDCAAQANALTDEESQAAALACGNSLLGPMNPRERVAWALNNLPGPAVFSSSFGAQSAVGLHLVTSVRPGIPVVLIDTGYLFPETYRFIDELEARLSLNLQVYRPQTSSAWQEARHGSRWSQGAAALERYNQENKVEPMERALRELDARVWVAGLRRSQSASRQNIRWLEGSGERWKIHPIADWSDRDVHHYLKTHDLPYHPLWEKGYVSIGDVHTTRSLHEVNATEETRFFGGKRECGLHEIDLDTI